MKLKTRLDFLKGIDMFAGISARLLSRIASEAKEVKKSAGTVLFEEGDKGDAAYLIVDGNLRIRKGNMQLATRSKGEWVGEMAILEDAPRSTSVVALGPVRLLKFKPQEFLSLFGKQPSLARAVQKSLSAKLREDVDRETVSFQQHQRVLQELKLQRDALLDALNHLPIGVVLVDRNCAIILVNRSARTILKQEDGLIIRSDRLSAGNSDETSVLRRSIRDAVKTGAGVGSNPGSAINLSRKYSKRALSILVLPLASEVALQDNRIPAAAVFVSDPEAGIGSADQILRRLYGLTPAEVKVVLLLLQGKTPEEASQELQVTMNTLRTHIKNVFQKTNTTRQSELIRLLLTSPAALLA